MKKIVITLLISLIIISTVIAQGELVVELGKPEILPREGFEQEVFLPFTIKNIGDQPITSRFPIKSISSASTRSGIGYPLYLYTGEITDPNFTPNPEGVPIIKTDGSVYFQKPVSKEVSKLPSGVVVAPTITLQPGESLSFDQQGLMNSFLVANTGTYTFGYEVDSDNEIPNIIKTKATASITLEVSNPNIIKGPNDKFKLSKNQYWFYFKNLGECVSVAIPENTEVCLLTDTPFAFKMSIGAKEVTLYHFFSWWSTTTSVDTVQITASEDGFVLTY